jgi:hypothetical protein
MECATEIRIKFSLCLLFFPVVAVLFLLLLVFLFLLFLLPYLLLLDLPLLFLILLALVLSFFKATLDFVVKREVPACQESCHMPSPQQGTVQTGFFYLTHSSEGHSIYKAKQVSCCPYCAGTSNHLLLSSKIIAKYPEYIFGLFSINYNMFLIITSDFQTVVMRCAFRC